MRALAQGADQAAQIEAAVRAGVDLLLCAADRDALGRIEAALVGAAARGGLRRRRARRIEPSRGRSARVARVGRPGAGSLGRRVRRAPSAVARARRAIDHAVRGDPRLPADARILAIMPQPTDLTPADTSSTVAPGLGRALRTRFASVEEVVVGIAPTDAEIAGVRSEATSGGFDAVVVGTIDAIRQPGQLELVRAVAAAGPPVVAVALRTPWDVARLPGRGRRGLHLLDPARLARCAGGGAGRRDPVRGPPPGGGRPPGRVSWISGSHVARPAGQPNRSCCP